MPTVPQKTLYSDFHFLLQFSETILRKAYNKFLSPAWNILSSYCVSKKQFFQNFAKIFENGAFSAKFWTTPLIPKLMGESITSRWLLTWEELPPSSPLFHPRGEVAPSLHLSELRLWEGVIYRLFKSLGAKLDFSQHWRKGIMLAHWQLMTPLPKNSAPDPYQLE